MNGDTTMDGNKSEHSEVARMTNQEVPQQFQEESHATSSRHPGKKWVSKKKLPSFSSFVYFCGHHTKIIFWITSNHNFPTIVFLL